MYKVEIESRGNYLFGASSKGYKFNIDASAKSGITPPDALLASLGSCIGVYLRKYAEGSRLQLGEFKVILEAELSTEKPVCFRKINVAVDLGGVEFDERRKKAILDFLHNCPVHNTLKFNPEVEVSLR
jgi:uncharacterized OsmC-like protein